MNIGLKLIVGAKQFALLCAVILAAGLVSASAATDGKATDPKAGAKPGSDKSTNAAPKEIIIPKSVFTFDLKTSNDPFYPLSTRIHPKPVVPTNTVSVATNGTPTTQVRIVEPPDPYKTFALKGITGVGKNRLALINTGIKNYDFAPGDTLVVKTPGGLTKISIVEIRDKSVVVLIEGQKDSKELLLPTGN